MSAVEPHAMESSGDAPSRRTSAPLSWNYRFWKRTLDVLLAAPLLLLCAPGMLVIGLWIRIQSPGPALFRQTRIGHGFRPFQMLKFRTMSANAEKQGGALTIGDDARVTKIGRTLRKFKLDELPQLWNVLKGDMSLVGPRPEVPQYVEPFRDDYQIILAVRPGITDAASLRYFDEARLLAEAADPEQEYVRRILPEKIAIAKEYVAAATLWNDLWILARTVARIARGVRSPESGVGRSGRHATDHRSSPSPSTSDLRTPDSRL